MGMTKEIFEINDRVMHYREGIGRIYSHSTVGDKEYFLVQLERGSGETIYVPRDNAKKVIRHLMNQEQADQILDYMRNVEKTFNANTKQRRDNYKKLVSSGDIKEIALLSRHLQLYKEGHAEKSNARLGQVDLDILMKADDILMDELSIVYNVDRNSIKDFVDKKINEK